MVDEIIYRELSYRLMQAVFEVHNTLGPGFVERIHEEALTCSDKGLEIDPLDATTWSVLVGGSVIIAFILFLKFIKSVLKILLITAVLAAVAYVLIDAGVIPLP